jgi:polysaccharide biosynthesis protein PslA
MDNTMSRIGASVRPVVFGSANASLGVRVVDPGLPCYHPATAGAVAMLVDVVACLGAPMLAGMAVPAAGMSRMGPDIGILGALLMLVLGACCGAYGDSAASRGWSNVRVAVRNGLFVAALIATGVVLLAPGSVVLHRPMLQWALAASGILLALLAIGRGMLAAVATVHPSRRFAPRTVVVGSGDSPAQLMELVRSPAGRSMRLVGVVDEYLAPLDVALYGVPYLGSLDALLTLIRRGSVDQVVLALPWSQSARIEKLASMIGDHPVDVCLAADPLLPGPESSRLMPLSRRPIHGWAGVVKRAEDLLVGGLMLAICAIPMAVIALLVRLDSPGPVLFRQRRTGFNNQDFEMLKFRTMYYHMEDQDVRQQITPNDPRVTRVGAILRRTSLDELPQIFNVLRGHMSIVGPRPHAPGTRAGERLFEQVVGRYAARHRVKPGLTGLAQVRGFRGGTPTEDRIVKRVESDLEYIETWSLWLDLSILLRTAVIVLRMQNAY